MLFPRRGTSCDVLLQRRMTQSTVVLRRLLDLRDGAVIKTPVSVSRPWRQHNAMRPPPPKIDTLAIWDTGATNTAFEYGLVAELGLTPQRPAKIGTSHGLRPAHFHLANVYLFKLPCLPSVTRACPQNLRSDSSVPASRPHPLLLVAGVPPGRVKGDRENYTLSPLGEVAPQ